MNTSKTDKSMEKRAGKQRKLDGAGDERASTDSGTAEAAYDNMSYLEMMRLKEQL